MHKFEEGMCFLFQQYCLHSSRIPHNYKKGNRKTLAQVQIKLPH